MAGEKIQKYETTGRKLAADGDIGKVTVTVSPLKKKDGKLGKRGQGKRQRETMGRSLC